MKLYHPADPAAAGMGLWNFVYLHGAAENLAARLMRDNEWPDVASDYCCIDEPHPTKPGEYQGMLYGIPCAIVLAVRYGLLGGRVALTDKPSRDDAEGSGYRHVFSPEEWR